MNEIRIEPLFQMRLNIVVPIDVGQTPEGHRMIVVIVGGEFHGPKVSGTVVSNSGADWARIRADGSLTIDARLCLKTTDGAFIYTTYTGRFMAASSKEMSEILNPMRVIPVDQATYYCRTAALFETAASEYSWLNNIVAMGSGCFESGGVDYEFHTLL
jgi:hypothetical protein